MKTLIILLFFTLAAGAIATEIPELTKENLKKKAVLINELQNKMLMKGSTVEDIDKLFSHYTDDFIYIHEVYGGTYTREHLYNNSVKYLKDGEYQMTDARYKIISIIAGYKAVSLERQQTYQGVTSNHLTVFEFEGDQISRIIEYWK
ncbi:hypothetical protein [Microbulbifer sp. PSTR4-B]|uniref:hypothetical protein n=1 Tax=Microbulbifer sp. PSTR4-B TaxID=3243396 RepID=UPI00403A5CE6